MRSSPSSFIVRPSSFVLRLSSLVLFLAACSTAAPPADVAPPLVITVVVTPTGGAPAASTASPAATASPHPAAYPPPFQNSLTAVYQPFERGFMIYLSDRKAVWTFIQAVVNNAGTATPTRQFGQWLAFPDTFNEGDPEIDPAIIAPEGLLQPKRGFGKVWREQPAVREAIGWGLEYELPYPTVVTDYSIGVFDAAGNYTPQSFIHTLTIPDGILFHIDEAAQLWSQP